MADIQNILGTAPQITPLVGAEGRNFVQEPSALEGLAKLGEVGLGLFGAIQANRQQRAFNQEVGDIEETVARSVDPVAIQEINDAAQKSDRMEAQGIKSVNPALVRNKLYADLTAKYRNNPDLLDVVDKAFKKSNPMAEDLEEVYKTEQATLLKNRQTALDFMRSSINNPATGITTVNMTDAQVEEYYMANIAPDAMVIEARKKALDDLKIQVEANKISREEASLQAIDLLNDSAGKVTKSYTNQANVIINGNASREEKLTQLTAFHAEIKAQVYSSAGTLLTPAQVDERLKSLDTLHQANIKMLDGSLSGADATVMENRNRFLTAAASNGLLNNSPKLTEDLAKLELLGRSMQYADITTQRSVLGKFANQVVKDALSPSPVTGGLGEGDPSSGIAKAAEKATDLSRAVSELPKVDEISATAFSKLFVRGVNDYENGNSNVMFNMVGALANPKTVEIVGQAQNQDEVISRITPAIEKFGSDVMTTATTRLKQYEGQYTKSVTKEGLIRLTPTPGSKGNAQAFKTIENTINNAIKAMAHVNGTTDYTTITGQQ